MGNTRNTGYLQNIVQYDASNNVILPSLIGTGTRMIVSSSTGLLSTQSIPTLSDLSGVPTSRTLTINGVTYDLTANRSWSALPVGGTTGQILTKNSGTDYDAAWMDNYADWTSVVKHRVKAGESITKGQAVYVSSADGTNMIVSKASNASEGTSSKTMGLLESTVSNNGIANVVTEGLLAGLNTASANAGDPVWLGTNGALIFGLLNKPVAPAHLVFIGVVTRVQQNNGEIFVKVQNGFELDELHDLSVKNASDGDMIKYVASTGLWTKIAASTTNIVEGTNLYYTTTRANADFDTRLATKSTTNLSEGTNLYYTDTRVGTYLTTNSYATQSYVGTQIANLVASSPAALDTLNELAAALGNDAAFSTTVSTALGNRLRVDINTQGLSAILQGYGRTNLGLGTAATSNTGDFAASSHSHIISDVTGLQTALDGKQASLGFTPYNSTNPSGYITGITSGNVTTALGFTPYNSTNPAGYITADSTKLPLAGGTMSGIISFTNVTGNKIDFYYATGGSGDRYGVQVQDSELRIHSGAAGVSTGGITFGKSTGTVFTEALRIRNDGIIQAVGYLRTAGATSNTVYFSGGASSVEFGNVFGQGTTNRTVMFRGSSGASVWWGGPDANGNTIPFTAIDATSGEFTFWRNSGGTGGGAWTQIMTMNASGLTMVSGNFIGNVTGNVSGTAGGETLATITGRGASTTNAITINRNAGGAIIINRDAVTNYNGLYYATAGTYKWFIGMRENLSSNNHIHYSEQISQDILTLNVANGNATIYGNLAVGNSAEVLGLIQMGSGGRYGMGVSGAYTNVYGHNSGLGVRLGSYDGTTFTPVLTAANGGAVTITGNVSAANLSGTNTGDQTNISGYSTSVYIGNSSTKLITDAVWAGAGGYPGYQFTGGNSRFGFSSTAGYVDVYTDGNFYAGIDLNGSNNLVLHTGNYSSYALPLSGGSLSGNLGIGSSMITYTSYDTPNMIVAGAGDVNWAFGSSHADVSNYWMQVKFYGTGDDNRGFRVLDKNSDVVRFRVNGAGNAYVQNNLYAATAIITPTIYSGGGPVTFGNNVYINPSSASWAEGLSFVMPSTSTWGGLRWRRERSGYDGNWAIGYTALDSSDDLVFIANNGGAQVNNILRLTKAGNVSTVGSFTASGDVTAYSDARIKENIFTIDNALEKMLLLRGVYYNRTDKDDKSQKVGVIAQEIQQVLPQVVQEQIDGMLSVSYGNMAGLFIEAIKEQQTQIESQKSEIDKLKDLVQQLINR